MAYNIQLSTKSVVKIDREELLIVQEAIQQGSKFVKVKSGILNPSYIVSIEPDYKRLEGMKYLDKLPDMFERIGGMISLEEYNNRLKIEEETKNKQMDELTKEQRKALIESFKPDFLKKKHGQI